MPQGDINSQMSKGVNKNCLTKIVLYNYYTNRKRDL
jgi:hypothetical protein